MKKELKFIDLFAGLGGFHLSIQKLGHSCVFSSEKKELLAKLYKENYGIIPNRDIQLIEDKDIPEHDILCAGFPCQPFSKAGNQLGLEDEANGSLFNRIVGILKYHKPKYFILENVRNLQEHNDGDTWRYIKNQLGNNLGYTISSKVISPHHIGIPQHRERFFIVGSLNGLEHFQWPEVSSIKTSVFDYLDSNSSAIGDLESEKSYVLDLWQEFLDRIPNDSKLPSWPIWSMEYEATYPFEKTTPFNTTNSVLGRVNGSFGRSLKGLSRAEKFANLPSYARREELTFPKWKQHYIRSNRAFFEEHKERLRPVIYKLQELDVSSWQKFEWNIQGGKRNVRDYLIQFRGSGVRLKRTNFFPSLVTINTQIPIIGWEERYMSPEEGARIQALDGIKLPSNNSASFGALGNAVNAKIVELIASSLILESNKPIIEIKTQTHSISHA